MTDTKAGPLQDYVRLTPANLYYAGIVIVEVVPNYYRFRCVKDGKWGALHDTPQQAIMSARKCFGVWEEEAV